MAKEEDEGAWIFVSHSHKDLEKVRFIRNEFEKRRHNPLLFFLKCLDDESELDDLIKREITERNWFVLCDSLNARSSKWVQEEVKMIKSLEGKVFKKINLNDDLGKQLDDIDNFSKRATVFISHTMKDESIGRKLIDKFKEHEFGVFDYKNITTSMHSLKDVMHSVIDDVLGKGFFFFFLSEETFKSIYVIEEIVYAISKSARVIPVFVDEFPNVELLAKQAYQTVDESDNDRIKALKTLQTMHMFRIDSNDMDGSLNQLVDVLKNWTGEKLK